MRKPCHLVISLFDELLELRYYNSATNVRYESRFPIRCSVRGLSNNYGLPLMWSLPLRIL